MIILVSVIEGYMLNLVIRDRFVAILMELLKDYIQIYSSDNLNIVLLKPYILLCKIIYVYDLNSKMY